MLHPRLCTRPLPDSQENLVEKIYHKPSLDVLGELRDVTGAAQGGFISDLVHGVLEKIGAILDGS